MTDAELNEIERLANKATAGPWSMVYDGSGDYTVGTEPDPQVNPVASLHGPIQTGIDAEFIASARTAVPRLVAALREARAAVALVRAPSIMCRRLDLDVIERLSAIVPPRPSAFAPALPPEAFDAKTTPIGEAECDALRRILAERECRYVLWQDTIAQRDALAAENARLRGLATTLAEACWSAADQLDGTHVRAEEDVDVALLKAHEAGLINLRAVTAKVNGGGHGES